MLAIPPYILLILYGAFLLFFIFFAFANIFSIAKYGGGTFAGFVAVFLFIAASAIVLFLTWQALPPLDWQTPMPILQNTLTF